MSNTRHASADRGDRVHLRPLSEDRLSALRRLAIGEATEAQARRARAKATRVVAWGRMTFHYCAADPLFAMVRDDDGGTNAFVYASLADLNKEWAEVELVATRLASQGEAELWTPEETT